MTGAGVRIVLTRWSPLMAIGVLGVTAVLAAGPLLTLLDADTLTERIVMAVFTAARHGNSRRSHRDSSVRREAL